MKDSDLPISAERERHIIATASPSPRPLILRFVAWCMVAVWRTGVDWRTKRPFLTRATAHLSIIVLTVVTIGLSGIGIPPPRAAIGRSSDDSVSPLKVASPTEPNVTPPPSLALSANQSNAANADTVARLPVPHTVIPDRLRAGVTTYTVQPGDTIFDVASRFSLTPETIVWSNREALQDAPWLIQLGLELFILPVDGMYHIVRADDTVASPVAATERHVVPRDATIDDRHRLPRSGQTIGGPDRRGGIRLADDCLRHDPRRVDRPNPAGKVRRDVKVIDDKIGRTVYRERNPLLQDFKPPDLLAFGSAATDAHDTSSPALAASWANTLQWRCSQYAISAQDKGRLSRRGGRPRPEQDSMTRTIVPTRKNTRPTREL